MDGPPEPPTDDGHGAFRHPETLDNRSPAAVVALYSGVIQFLQQYGWFMLFGVILLFVIKQRLMHYLATRPSRRSAEEQDLHRYDSETVLQRQEGFEASRRRLQEKMDADSARFAEEQKKREEEKRKQKIADWDNHLEGKGYRSKYKPQDASGSAGSSGSGSSGGSSQPKRKPTYRPSDYNPLTGGGGGSSGYRPPARRGGGG